VGRDEEHLALLAGVPQLRVRDFWVEIQVAEGPQWQTQTFPHLTPGRTLQSGDEMSDVPLKVAVTEDRSHCSPPRGPPARASTHPAVRGTGDATPPTLLPPPGG